MAGFKTHIGTSTVIGIGYGVGGVVWYDVPPVTGFLAGCLCSVSGMLPDIDSDSGVPLRESLAFAAAVVPMLMLDRFRAMGLSPESIALAGSLIYLSIRFGFGTLLKKYTVHRGMFHSIPAAIIFAEAAFLLCTDTVLKYRVYKAAAVALGVMSHLVLDEIWSLHFQRGLLRVKKSFGTALKLWGDDTWANISTYAKLILLTYILMNERRWMNFLRPENLPQPTIAGESPIEIRR